MTLPHGDTCTYYIPSAGACLARGRGVIVLMHDSLVVGARFSVLPRCRSKVSVDGGEQLAAAYLAGWTMRLCGKGAPLFLPASS